MGLIRATQSPTTIQRNFKVTRLRRRDPIQQVRYLWGWGKRSRGSWSQDQDELEERLRRHQALMMHRYTKALRRRSLWDRDTSSSYPAWMSRGGRPERQMSSGEPMRAKVEECETKDRTGKQVWQEFHKDFESFKRAVDRAIERDPVGTLFGRRLRSPETPNNSSWTSWSWIFDPKEIKQEPSPLSDKESNKPGASVTKSAPSSQPVKESPISEGSAPSITHTSTSSKTASTIKSSRTIVFKDRASVATEYIYDPISGRKVPQSSSTTPLQHEMKKTVSPAKEPSRSDKAASFSGFLQTMFGEHGAEIPVKTYKPTKVYGYTGDPKPPSKPDLFSSDKKTEGFETSRKREYNELRLRTIGNNIDATNFNCEPWNKGAEPTKTDTSREDRARSSTAPDENAPLFSGTTYASRSDKPSDPRGDWLAKEGFRARQGMTILSLKESTTPSAPSNSAIKIQTALDRVSSSVNDVPVKIYKTRLQAAMDRIIPQKAASASEKSHQKLGSFNHDSIMAQDQREDVDLLRASDVRAASKTARITKQDMEDKKKADRTQLEKDFEARQRSEEDTVDIRSRPLTSLTPTTSSLGNVRKHIRDHPQGIVAKTMQSVGLVNTSGRASSAVTNDTGPQASSNATIQATDVSGLQLKRLGTDLKNIYEEQHGKIDEAAQYHSAPKKSAILSFAKPTIKVGVVRDLQVERHTHEFEPKIASIVDKAKSVKRELYDARLVIGDYVNERAITAMANRGIVPRETKPTSVAATESINATPHVSEAAQNKVVNHIVEHKAFDSPFILLMYSETTKDVSITPLNNLIGQASTPATRTNLMAAIGSLNNPNAFVKHFVDLDVNGYELLSGGGQILIFQKRQTVPVAKDELATTSDLTSTSDLRSTIAAAEAAAQPKSTSVEAANVLDKIPLSIPIPSPAAPTAPTSSRPTNATPASPSTVIPLASISKPSTKPLNSPQATVQVCLGPEAETQTKSSTSPRKPRSRSRVSRQEEVFSGQVRLEPQTTALPDPSHFQKQTPASTSSGSDQYRHEREEPRPGFFARVRRIIRRTILTGLAFGAGAYGIGVIAEALNAKAQIAQGEAGGPMRRLVLEEKQKDRQRAGIYSTESSR